MSAAVDSLRNVLENPPLSFEDLEPLTSKLEHEDQQRFYSALEELAESIDQLRDKMDSVRHHCHALQINKETLWQLLTETSPEHVIRLHRDASTRNQLLHDVLATPQVLPEIRSRVVSDPRVAELFPTERLDLFQAFLDIARTYYELNLQVLSWIEEYMDDVIKQAQLPSWVGSVSIGADSSDHHLG